MLIRPAMATDDDEAIWVIIEPVIRAGETYALDRDMSRADALAYWTDGDHETFVAEDDGQVIGTYFLRANQSGGGGHVCNCGYITAGDSVGRASPAPCTSIHCSGPANAAFVPCSSTS